MTFWDSIPDMRRIARGLACAATVLLALGVAAWSVSGDAMDVPLVVAICAFVLGTAAVACGLFAWFRLEHLRELDRMGRAAQKAS